MTDYQKYINALRKCAKEHENDRTPTGHIRVSDLCKDTANLLEELKQEPKTGHWIIYDVHGHKACKCSKCDKDVGYPCNYKYCPYCGAMIVESKELSE